jgi:hypothetical protein
MVSWTKRRSMVGVGGAGERAMYTLVRKGLLVATIVLMAGGCAQQPTETIKLFDDLAAVNKPYGRLLIVDVSSDPIMQERFEDQLVRGLVRAGTEAVPSHPRLGGSDGILQDDINRMSDEIGADGILITHIVSIDTTMDMEEGREEIVSTCRGGNPVDFFLYDREVLTEPDSIRVAHTVAVITNLYDSASGKRVWSIQSTCFNKVSLEEVLFDETKAIVRQLGIDKLI